MFSRIMEGRKTVCLCLLALACLQAIQNISAKRKVLLESVLGDLRSLDCDIPSGIISGNPELLPTSKFDLVAKVLHIRRLLERGCSTFGSPLNVPLSGALSSPLNGPLSEIVGSPLNGPLSGVLSSPLNGPLSGGLSSPLNGALSLPLNGPLSGVLSLPLNGPLSGGLSSPLNGALSLPLNDALSPSPDGPSVGVLSPPVDGPLRFPSLGSGFTNFPPNLLHGSFSGFLHN